MFAKSRDNSAVLLKAISSAEIVEVQDTKKVCEFSLIQTASLEQQFVAPSKGRIDGIADGSI